MIDFYRENDIWYAWVTGHTKEERAMVGEANIFLDRMYEGGCSELEAVFDDDGNISYRRPGCSLWVDFYPDDQSIEESIRIAELINDDRHIVLEIINHNKDGAYYRVFNSAAARHFGVAEMEVWLNNVIHSLCGAHPRVMIVQPGNSDIDDDEDGWPDMIPDNIYITPQ